MEHWQFESFGEGPRTLIVSQRANKQMVWLSAAYEFEELLAEIEPADIVSLNPGAAPSKLGRIGLKMLERHTQGRWSLARPYRPEKDTRYDLLFFDCSNVWDLLERTGRIQDFTRRARVSVCFLHELWASRLPLSKEYVLRLQQFDAVFLVNSGTVDGLSEQIGRPCYHLPLAIDALAACPYPNPQHRCIDVLSVGRRVAAIHEQLKEHAEKHPDFFYYRDTIAGLGQAKAPDPRDHRRQLMALLKRSKYFLANRAKVDQPELTKAETEVGGRFFEGAATGCVMIGEPPVNKEFDVLFDWPDAVIPNPRDASGIFEILEELEADVARVERIRNDGIVNCLRRHDWAHRWKTVLDHVGLSPTPGLEARLNALEQLADQVAT